MEAKQIRITVWKYYHQCLAEVQSLLSVTDNPKGDFKAYALELAD
jgi:hypothetical protein